MREIKNTDCCRVCLVMKKPLLPLFRYQPIGNYAEMLTAIANVEVDLNDGYPDKICTKCGIGLEKAYLLKLTAEKSDAKLKEKHKKLLDSVPTKKIAFNSITDIKTEIDTLVIKKEPCLDVEIEVLSNNHAVENPVDSLKGKDIVIANTVIRKVEPGMEGIKIPKLENVKPKISWNAKRNDEDMDTEYLDDDFLHADSDDDYLPPRKERKIKRDKFKKPLFDGDPIKGIRALRVIKRTGGRSTRRIIKKEIKLKRLVPMKSLQVPSQDNAKSAPTFITCYPLLGNGQKGPPVLLKRPKDATILKVHPNYKPRKLPRQPRAEKTLRLVKQGEETKQREKHVCPICGILTYGLGNHLSTHSEKKRFSCNQCSKSFAQKTNLLIHAKMHSGVKDHICEVCGAGFYSQKSLLRHNLIHKGERPYGCDLCPKRFIARCDLTRHLRIHSGYKPFKCGTCTMSFNAKHQLQNHERMHTGERPYTCQVCNVSFSYKVNLNNHVSKVHGINLKFKSIHVVTEEILRKELDMLSETRNALMQALPHFKPDETAPPVLEHSEIQIDDDWKIEPKY